MATLEQKEAIVAPIVQKTHMLIVGDLMVPVINSHLVGDKTMEMIGKALAMITEPSAHGILISTEDVQDNDGNSITAGFLAADGMIIIALSNIVEEAATQIINGTKNAEHLPMNYRHAIQLIILRDLFHELHHSVSWRKSARPYEWRADDYEEADAEVFADVAICEFAKANSVEPVIGGDPFLEPLIQDFRMLLSEGSDENEEWQNNQIEMIDNNICYKDIETAITLRAYLRSVATDSDDPSWDEKAITMNYGPVTQPAMTPEVVTGAQQFDPAYDGYDDIPWEMHGEDQMATVPTVQPAQGAIQPVAQVQQVQTAVAQQPAAVAQPATAPDMQFVEFMNAMLKRLHRHMFDKCGWTGNGAFMAPGSTAIAEPVHLGDLPGATQYLTRYNGTGVNGQWAPSIPFQGTINGSLTKTGLPKYEFFLNINGEEKQRLFIVQNPDKIKAGTNELSRTAAEARSGVKICWLIDKGPVGGWTAKVEAGVGQIEPNISHPG